MKNIGFIGTGVMGASMVRNLIKEGYTVSVFNRTANKSLPLVADGAILCQNIRECVKNKDAVITMIGFPKDVEEVYFGKQGVIEFANPGTYIIDMTTTSPQLAIKINEAAQACGLNALDAPVSGGDVGAKNATLAIMVGGKEEDFNACVPLFEAMGKNIVYEGVAGAGQHTKMANQIAVAGSTIGVCEAVAYAKSVGLDPKLMLKTIATGAAGSWQIDNNGEKMVDKDYAPGFFIKHFVKDMKIALEESKKAGTDLWILQEICDIFDEMDSQGHGELGTQAVIQQYVN